MYTHTYTYKSCIPNKTLSCTCHTSIVDSRPKALTGLKYHFFYIKNKKEREKLTERISNENYHMQRYI